MNSVLSPDLLDVLACPCPHHATLEQVERESGIALRCQRCQSRFPIRDGVPVLLLDQAVPGPRGVGGEP